MTINMLSHLHLDIDDRVRTISEDNLDWPCRSDCDGCLRRLLKGHPSSCLRFLLSLGNWDCFLDDKRQ